MNKSVTVSQAIRRGKLLTRGGTLKGVLIGLPFSFIVSFYNKGDNFSEAVALAVAMLVGVLAGNTFVAWSATKWRIWAFTHVDDMEEMQKAAIAEKLIYADRTQKAWWIIESNADKKRIDDIQKRLDALAKGDKRGFIDDPALPAEVKIYKSTGKIIFTAMAIAVAFGAVAAGEAFQGLYGPAGLILIPSWGIAYYVLYRGDVFDKVKIPVITIGNKGITTRDVDFVGWADITNEQVMFHQLYKSSYYEFSYNHPGGKESINITDAYINHAPLMHMLYVYRNRFIAGLL